MVVGVTIATTIVTPAASLLGGWLASRYFHMKLYLVLGAFTGLICLGTAASPHTPLAYLVSTMAYDITSGVSYTIYGVTALDLANNSPVASTRLGMLGAAMNASVVYMTLADGWGYKLGGISGLYLAEGTASLISALIWFPLLHAALRHSYRTRQLENFVFTGLPGIGHDKRIVKSWPRHAAQPCLLQDY